jgi:hypothetical protein
VTQFFSNLLDNILDEQRFIPAKQGNTIKNSMHATIIVKQIQFHEVNK